MTASERIEQEMDRWHGQILAPATTKKDRLVTFEAMKKALSFAAMTPDEQIAELIKGKV